MFDYLTTEDYPIRSKEGVFVTLKRPCNSLRDKLILQTSAARNNLRAMLKEIYALGEDDQNGADELNTRVRMQHKQITRVYFLECVAGVSGMTIDGEPATAETLFDLGDEEIMAEVKQKIDAYLGLSVDEQKNSESPTTSGEPVVATTTDTTAQFAEPKDTTSSETA